MEELWSKGEAGGDFDSTPRIIEPDHFQCLFLIMGCIFSVQLLVLLWDILTAPPTNHLLDYEDPQSRLDQTDTGNQFYGLMSAGLFACLLITFNNLYLFSTALWTPITRETEMRKDKWGEIVSPAKPIFTGGFEMNEEKLVNNKEVAFVILGYGAVTSFIFIFLAMMRSLGTSCFLLLIFLILYFFVGMTYYNSTNQIRPDKKGKLFNYYLSFLFLYYDFIKILRTMLRAIILMEE